MRGAGAGEPARLPVRKMEQPVTPRVGVSPVVVPPAPLGPAVVCAVPSELPLTVVSTPEPRVLRFRSYSVPDRTPPGASLSAT